MHEADASLNRSGRWMLAATLTALAMAGMYWLRFEVYPTRFVPLSYTLPLLLVLWHGYRGLHWTLAAFFALTAALKLLWIIPESYFDNGGERAIFLGMQLANIGVAALVADLVVLIGRRLDASNHRLAAANAELEASNEELAAREEEISRQNEELQSQSEGLEKQAEELRFQSDELQAVNEELSARESTLQSLLASAGPATHEAELLDQICASIPELLGPHAAAAAVLVRSEDLLRVHAHCGFGPGGPRADCVPCQGGVATLVMERGQTAMIEDLAERPDLEPLQPAEGEGLRSLLATPLSMRGSPIGTLEVYSRAPRAWSEQEAILVEWLAAQCSRIWETIRLRDELQVGKQQLETFNQELEARVVERTAELERRSFELRLLASQLTTTEQRERRQLAQVLHDDLQQLLVAAKLRLAAVTPDNFQTHVQEARNLIGQAIGQSRTLTVELSPPILFEERFETALAWLARRMHEKHGLEVSLEIDPCAEPAGDDWRIFLFRAISECLFNVVKHGHTNAARIGARREQETIHVVVEDRGRGFDPTVLQSERSESFGLFSLRQRCLLLGGRTIIDSRPGHGTRIEIVAPAAGEMRRAASPPSPTVELRETALPETKADGRAIRVLLVDDHRILREGLVSLLHGQPGLEIVAEAADGAAAVELARKHLPDVVVMDITMPVMNGIEATRILQRELPDIKVIGMSMHETEEMARSIRAAGAVSYVTKGGPVEQLLDEIRLAAATRRGRTSDFADS